MPTTVLQIVVVRPDAPVTGPSWHLWQEDAPVAGWHWCLFLSDALVVDQLWQSNWQSGSLQQRASSGSTSVNPKLT